MRKFVNHVATCFGSASFTVAGEHDGEFVSRRKSSERVLPRHGLRRATFVKRYSLFIRSAFGFDGLTRWRWQWEAPRGKPSTGNTLITRNENARAVSRDSIARARAPYKFPRGRRATGQEFIRVLGTDRRMSRRAFHSSTSNTRESHRPRESCESARPGGVSVLFGISLPVKERWSLSLFLPLPLSLALDFNLIFQTACVIIRSPITQLSRHF